MQRTLRGGVWFGIASGAGVATADGLYAALAALGLSAVVSRAPDSVFSALGMVGGGVLAVLAWRAWHQSKDACVAREAITALGAASTYGSALVLTLSNPATIMSFAAIMAGLGSRLAAPGSGVAFVAGIATGSLAWWVFVACAIALVRERASSKLVSWAGRASAVVLGVAAVAALTTSAWALAGR